MLNVFEQSLGTSPLAQLVVDADGVLAAATPRARELLQLPPGAEGLPFTALARECDGPEVASLVERSVTERAPLSFANQNWAPRKGTHRRLNGGIVPLRDDDGQVVGATLTVEQADGPDLLEQHQTLKRDVSELRFINDELRQRTDELNLVAIFLESVLTSLRGAVVVIDTRGVVRIWNPQAERLWGIARRDAMGKTLAALDLRTDFAQLTPCIHAALHGEVDDGARVLPVSAANGDETPYAVSATPLLGPGGSVHGATLLFVERAHRD